VSERDSWPEAPSLDDPPGSEDEAAEAEVETPQPEVETAEAMLLSRSRARKLTVPPARSGSVAMRDHSRIFS